MYVYVFMHVHVYVYVYSTKFTYVCCGLCVILHVHVCPFIFNVVHHISHVWYAALYMYIQCLLSLSLSLSLSLFLLSSSLPFFFSFLILFTLTHTQKLWSSRASLDPWSSSQLLGAQSQWSQDPERASSPSPWCLQRWLHQTPPSLPQGTAETLCPLQPHEADGSRTSGPGKDHSAIGAEEP